MQKFLAAIKKIPFYILPVSLYPVFFLWYANYYQVESYVLPQSLSISISFSLFVFVLFTFILRSIRKGALVTAIVLILFFSYGHIFSLVDSKILFGFVIGRHRYIAPLFIAIGVGLSFALLRIGSNNNDVTMWFNIFFGILFGLILFQIAVNYGSVTFSQAAKVNKDPGSASGINITGRPASSAAAAGESEPDIYYIVLDGYSRSDILLENGFDNTEFLDGLKNLGFIIPECGQSNYDRTVLSIASTLNMDYLDNLGISQSDLKYPQHVRKLEPYIKNSKVREQLHGLGYKFVTNVSSFFFIDIPDSDIYFKNENAKNFSSSQIIETVKFQQLFINSTFARIFVEWVNNNSENSKIVPLPVLKLLSPMSINLYGNFLEGTNYSHFQLGQNQLENLVNAAKITDKKFVYSHLLVTHKPFVFTSSGKFENKDQISYESYIHTIKYANTRLIDILSNLLHQASKPPIIIIQSDHSYTKDDSTDTRNFQAYYFPGMKQEDLDKNFTNVNAFRLIFSRYLGMDMSLLPEKSFLIDYKNPSNMQLLGKSCPP